MASIPVHNKHLKAIERLWNVERGGDSKLHESMNRLKKTQFSLSYTHTRARIHLQMQRTGRVCP